MLLKLTLKMPERRRMAKSTFNQGARLKNYLSTTAMVMWSASKDNTRTYIKSS